MRARDRDKAQMVIGGRPVGMPLSDTQGALIIRWLDSDGVMEALAEWLASVEPEPKRED